MHRHALAALIAAGFAFGAAQTASAADIARPVYKAPPVVAAYNWTGFYVGIHGGYAWGDLNTGAFAGSHSVDGWFGGGQLGWNWQGAGSPWVFGVELDSSFANIERDGRLATPGVTLNGHSDLDYFGTARGRIGYAFDRAMIYGTAGLAWANNEIGFSPARFAASSNTHVGFAVGGGLEWVLAGNWTGKVEYLYLGLGGESYTGPNGGRFDADIDAHTIKVGLNYRFDWGKAPVIAKY